MNARTVGRARAVGVLGVALSMLGIGAAWSPAPGTPTICPLRLLTGIPCPTCGMGRAVCAMMHGDLAGAVATHPFGPLVVAAALVAVFVAVADLVDGGARLVRLAGPASLGVGVALALETVFWWPHALHVALAGGWAPLLANGLLTRWLLAGA